VAKRRAVWWVLGAVAVFGLFAFGAWWQMQGVQSMEESAYDEVMFDLIRKGYVDTMTRFDDPRTSVVHEKQEDIYIVTAIITSRHRDLAEITKRSPTGEIKVVVRLTPAYNTRFSRPYWIAGSYSFRNP
jgi:hypothetical protein